MARHLGRRIFSRGTSAQRIRQASARRHRHQDGHLSLQRARGGVAKRGASRRSIIMLRTRTRCASQLTARAS